MAVTLDFRKFQQRLEGLAPGPVYLFMGEEAFLVQEALRLIKLKCVPPESMDFNCDVFDANETRGAVVRDTAELLPVMCQRRLVVYRNVDELKDSDWESLFPLFDRPIETTALVLTCENLDKRKKPYKKLSETAMVVELKSPYDSQLLDWIGYLAFQLGIQVTSDSAQLLRQFVGQNLTELHNELVKLKDYLGDRQKVEAADVMQVVSQTRVERIFDLTDAIGRRDRSAALHVLANLLEHGQSEIGILAMISRHFRILSQLKDGLRAGLSGARLSSRAGIPPFLLGQYMDQTKNWNDPKIQDTFAVLLDTDRALKSSAVPPHVWLENFVLKTCS